MSKKTITLCGSKTNVQIGLTKISDFYEKSGVSPEEKCLYLNRDKDIDIPLSPDDHIIVHGGEKIYSGDAAPQIGENPTVRNPIVPIFNGKKLNPGLTKAKITGMELQDLDSDLDSSKLFADLSGKVDAFIASSITLVVQDSDCYFTIPADDDGIVDLEKCAKKDRKPPKGQSSYKIRIDGDKHKVSSQIITGVAILGLVGRTFDEWTLNREFGGGRRKPIEKDEEIDLSEPGIERFETVRKQAQQG